MSRVQLVQKEQALPEVKEMYEKMEAGGTDILNLYRVLAHNADVMRFFLRLGSSLLTKAELSPKLRELVIMRIAKLTGSEYEWTQHHPIALAVGVSQVQLEAVSHWNSSGVFNDEERAVLQYADEVAQNVVAKDETFRTLQRYLSERSIVELTISIGYWGMVARLLVPLQVDIDTQSLSSALKFIGRKG